MSRDAAMTDRDKKLLAEIGPIARELNALDHAWTFYQLARVEELKDQIVDAVKTAFAEDG